MIKSCRLYIISFTRLLFEFCGKSQIFTEMVKCRKFGFERKKRKKERSEVKLVRGMFSVVGSAGLTHDIINYASGVFGKRPFLQDANCVYISFRSPRCLSSCGVSGCSR